MNIALVVHDLHEYGGHSLYTKVLADELSRRHDVVVFANRCERPVDARWQSHHVRAWRGGALACVQTFPLGMRSQAATLDRFEIRHMQGYCGGQPNVVTAHICVAAYLKSLREISRRHRLSLELMALAESRFYRQYEGRIIAVSQKVARELKEFYKVRGHVEVIRHGVDAGRFKRENRKQHRSRLRAEIGVREDQTLALFVGDLTKAHVHLKRLAQAAPEIQFVIVTRSSHYQWSAPNVHIAPPTCELERYYAAADAFIFPSSYDAFGMVLLEAMASGLTVFSSDCAGGSELINEGSDGFVAPLGRWVEMTMAGLRDQSLLRDVGREAERTAHSHDWASVARSVERLYFEVAATT